MVLLLGKSPQSRELCSKVWSLMVQQLRFRNRPNLKNPLPDHFNRARMLAVCKPVYPTPPRNCAYDRMVDASKQKENPVEDNPYAIFLAGKLRRQLASHPLVCVLHTNSYTQHELLNIKGSLFDMKFEMTIQEKINQNIVKLALANTRWSPLIPLFLAKTTLGFCSEADIAHLMKALKKMPQFVLIAAVVHDQILDRDAVEALHKLKDITNVRAQLCSTLANPSVTISHNLSTNMTALSNSLSSYVKQGEETSSSSSDSDSDSSSSSSSSDSDKEK